MNDQEQLDRFAELMFPILIKNGLSNKEASSEAYTFAKTAMEERAKHMQKVGNETRLSSGGVRYTFIGDPPDHFPDAGQMVKEVSDAQIEEIISQCDDFLKWGAGESGKKTIREKIRGILRHQKLPSEVK